MALRFFKDAALTSRISEGDFSNPDEDTFNGTTGESHDRQIFIANEHTVIKTALGYTDTTVYLAQPRFADGEIIIIGSEQVTIVSGGGTTTLQVIRSEVVGYAIGTTVCSGYAYSDIEMTVLDTTGTDETGWVKLALTQAGLTSATPGAKLLVGDKSPNQTLSFWRRVTVPAGSQVQLKRDLQLKATATVTPIG